MEPKDDPKEDPKKEDPKQTPDPSERIDKLEHTIKELTKAINAKKNDGDDPDDEDLVTKARKERENQNKKQGDQKALEAALKFSLGASDWMKTNQALLPKDVSDIFKAAEKENYDSAIEKDSAIKSGIIQSFFGVQENLDLLTPGLKQTLEDYLKLSKNMKQEKAQEIYDTIFEPSFEMLRRLKKAESLAKGHHVESADGDEYKNRMMEKSRKHYIGETKNA